MNKQFLIDLNNKKEEIKQAMKYSVIEVCKYRNTQLSIEEQFSNILYQEKGIQHFIHTYPKLKSIIDECTKQISLVSVNLKKLGCNDVKRNDNTSFNNIHKLMLPFDKEWWAKEADQLKQLITTQVSNKNPLVSDVNQQVVKLYDADNDCCTRIVWSFLVISSGEQKKSNYRAIAENLYYEPDHYQTRQKAKWLIASCENLYLHMQETEQSKEISVFVQPTPMPQGTSNQSLISNSVKEPERKKEQPKEKSAGIEPTPIPKEIRNLSLISKSTQTTDSLSLTNKSSQTANSLSLTSNKSTQTPNSHPVIKIQTLEERMNQSTNKANNLNEMKEAGKNQPSVRNLKNFFEQLRSE
ncbi:hypothetical protein ACQUIQ_002147 [Enterococcus hirae]